MELLADRSTRGFAPLQLGGIEGRLAYLKPRWRQVLEMILQGRLSQREAGVLLDLSPGNVSRWCRRVLRKLNDPLVTALIEEGALLPENHRAVGLAHHLNGEGVVPIARALRLTPHAVRRALDYIRIWWKVKRSLRGRG